MLDEELTEGHAGSLLHQHDGAGSSPLLRLRDALHGLQADPHQGRVEAGPRGLFQHLGPQLPLWDVVVSDLPRHWIPLHFCPLSFLHPQLLSRSVQAGKEKKMLLCHKCGYRYVTLRLFCVIRLCVVGR